MEKNAQVGLIAELQKIADKHPSKKHDEDHEELWKAIRMCCSIFWEIEEEIQDVRSAGWEILDMIDPINEKANNLVKTTYKHGNDLTTLANAMNAFNQKFPKICTMKKTALLIDGENVIDTVDLESWRYLKVQYITPTDWNEHAKLEAVFSWEVIEVSDWKYDINVNLESDTEGETATMTVNVDLLFIKY